MHIHIEPKDRWVLFRITGSVSSQDLLECIAAVAASVERYGLTRVLLDERGADHESDTHDAYQAGESEDIAAVAMQGYRLASVPAPENRRKNKIFETLMRNRSVNYRVFDSIEDAEAWLLA